MREIEMQRSQTNVPLLDSELRQACGEIYIGLSTRLNNVILYLQDHATRPQMEQAQWVVSQHNPIQLSPEQQQEQQLHVLRDAQTVLDTAEFVGESAAVQTLAAKIAWLEAEMRQLRGL